VLGAACSVLGAGAQCFEVTHDPERWHRALALGIGTAHEHEALAQSTRTEHCAQAQSTEHGALSTDTIHYV
jgi:hypothetical protein